MVNGYSYVYIGNCECVVVVDYTMSDFEIE